MSDSVALLVLVLLLAFNAYFVAAEFAMVAARRHHVEPAAANGSCFARMAMRSIDDLSTSLATTQLGITACSLLIGAVGEPAIAHLIEKPLHSWGVPDALQHPIALAIALLIVTFLHMVFGEMVPKNISLAKPGPSALVLGPSLRLVTGAAKPVVWVMNTSANFFVRHVLRATPTDDAGSTFSVEQLRSVVRESGASGSLDGDETALITGAIEFQSRTARDAMTPLADVVSIGADATVAATHAACVETGFSRLPVRAAEAAEGAGGAGDASDAGEFLGYVHLKDVLEGHPLGEPLPAGAVRPFVSVSPEAPLREVLEDMRRASTHVAAVRGNGSTGPLEGILSMADVLRDVVGAHR